MENMGVSWLFKQIEFDESSKSIQGGWHLSQQDIKFFITYYKECTVYQTFAKNFKFT